MKVVYFYRKSMQGNFSVERVFNVVRQNLTSEIKDEVFIPKYISKGFFKRVYDLCEAFFHQGDINHITGDVHFLNYLMRKDKTVLTILDCGFLQTKMSKISKAIIKLFWYILPSKKAEYITTISQFSKDEILSVIKFDPKKIIVIPVPLLEDFKYYKKKFNREEPVILQIGTAANKNLNNLFKALEGVKCHLNIVGHLNGEHLEKLKKYHIKFTNFSNLSDQRIIEKYKECDLVTFISTYEGFGMPIIEANAIGRVVITSNLPPMDDVSGGSACLVDPCDILSIRKGISKIIKGAKYREKLIKSGIKNAKRFNPKLIAKEYEALYEKIIPSQFYKR